MMPAVGVGEATRDEVVDAGHRDVAKSPSPQLFTIMRKPASP